MPPSPRFKRGPAPLSPRRPVLACPRLDRGHGAQSIGGGGAWLFVAPCSPAPGSTGDTGPRARASPAQAQTPSQEEVVRRPVLACPRRDRGTRGPEHRRRGRVVVRRPVLDTGPRAPNTTRKKTVSSSSSSTTAEVRRRLNHTSQCDTVMQRCQAGSFQSAAERAFLNHQQARKAWHNQERLRTEAKSVDRQFHDAIDWQLKQAGLRRKVLQMYANAERKA